QLLRHSGAPLPRDLPQLLLPQPALAVHGPAPGRGALIMAIPSARELAQLPIHADEDFVTAVIDGLSRPQKTLPCRFFYDARGSELFEEIPRLPEYSLTRTESHILAANAAEIVSGVPDQGVLIEFGSGSSRKTEILLEQLPHIASYIPIDV